ncbi:MAG: amino acid adenylation domain-containing protein, partial [Aquabacterium sp.]|nr:amino acid adenylation domain-containing protein [Ferruginibacter sp.]
AAYVPLDPDYPFERISYMVNDSNAKLIITSAASRKCLQPSAAIEVIEINSSWSQFDNQSKLNPGVAYRPNNLAYVIYTSGSTGRAKGVKMQSGALVNLLTWQESQFVNKKRRVMQFASLNFDVSFQEIFSTLCAGCTLYLINADRRKDVVELVKDIITYGLTHLFVPYIVLKNIAENILAVKNQSFWLEEVIVAGEQLIITDDIKRLLKKNIGAIINQYGPTEAHVVSSYRIDGTAPIPSLPPIGKPIANTQLYILGKTQELVPVGVAGELYIGGVQVAAGYINQPEQTSEKFIADFFHKDEASARLYKTGDLARWLPDGNIEYLGRIDSQVKIRGFRIELGEIESVLLQSGLVTNAVVVAKDHKSDNKVLVGYVVLANGFDKEAIQLYLQARLPGYMVPALWVALENIPLTNNGKVDKGALPEPDAMELLSNPYLAPGNELEEKLAVIWQDVLHVERVGITDNFFELGGHSLIAMRLVAVIRQQLDLKLAVNDIFIYPTIKAFTKNLIEKFKNPSLPLLNNKYLVPLKTTGNKIPLYIIAGGGGTSLRFKKFAEMMDKDQPVYGLQSPIDLPDIKEFPDTIEKIAAKFIEEILTINPNGPYALSGHCLGGIIAFEMAQQLQQKGKQLHQLLMFDTIIRKNENVQPANFKNLYHFKYRVQHAITKVLIKFDFETFLLRKHTRQAIRYKVTAMHRMYDKLKKKDQGNEELRFGGLEIFDESSNVYIAAARKYKMQPYNGEIILFYAKEHYYFMDISKNVTYRKLSLNEKTKNLWKEFSSGVKIHDVAGEHSTIFDPAHGNDFAQLLQMYLDDKANEEGKPS